MENAYFLLLVCILFNCNAAANVKQIESWSLLDISCRTPDSGVGDCINIKDCKIFQDFIHESDDYICGIEGDAIKVCCPREIPPSWIAESTIDNSQHKNIGLLPTNDCGMSLPISILFGNITELFEFPWAAILKYDIPTRPYACGASLISKRYVLTAAHCIRGPNKLISVRLGEYNFTTEIDCVEGIGENGCAVKHQDFDVSIDDAIVHPEFNPNGLVNDIALIRLPRDANINGDSVLPICLPVTEAEKPNKFDNYTVIGWGIRETGFPSNVLLKASVPIVEKSICTQKISNVTQITDNQFCAGGRNEQDACVGDIGGPLSGDHVYEDGTIRTLQYGIVSFGTNRVCGQIANPTVYTSVPKYVKWILDNIKP